METDVGKIGVIIVEDDLPVRQLVRSYLTDFSQITVLGEASTGTEALEILDCAQPNVVFLDIELPNTGGLSLAALLKEKNPQIGVAFITGYPIYAAQAFQLDAIDYLVKPISKEDVFKAIEKIERWMTTAKIIKSEQQENSNRIAVKNNHELRFLNLPDIFYIEKEHRYAVFHTVQGKCHCTETLNNLGKKLDSRFFRCHRSFIINIEKIDRIAPIADRIYEISFYSYPCKVTMGREKYEQLCRMIINMPD